MVRSIIEPALVVTQKVVIMGYLKLALEVLKGLFGFLGRRAKSKEEKIKQAEVGRGKVKEGIEEDDDSKILEGFDNINNT